MFKNKKEARRIISKKRNEIFNKLHNNPENGISVSMKCADNRELQNMMKEYRKFFK